MQSIVFWTTSPHDFDMWKCQKAGSCIARYFLGTIPEHILTHHISRCTEEKTSTSLPNTTQFQTVISIPSSLTPFCPTTASKWQRRFTPPSYQAPAHPSRRPRPRLYQMNSSTSNTRTHTRNNIYHRYERWSKEIWVSRIVYMCTGISCINGEICALW